VPKFGRKVPHLRCNSHTSFKVKRSKVRVTRPINADTHHIFQMPWPTNLPHTAGAPKQIQTQSVFATATARAVCWVLWYDFNVFNCCSGHSVIASQCWIKYYCHHKVIIIIFIGDNHRTTEAITAHAFQLAKILSSQLMLKRTVRHIFRMPRPTNFKLGTRMKDDDPYQPQAP